jgi:alpha-tubulin suppressor-like RCC1 family protein
MKKIIVLLFLLSSFVVVNAQCWKTVSAGGGFTLGIKTDGTLWGWGYNAYGQLGDSTFTDKNVPVQIGVDNNWEVVSAGSNHSSAIKTDGTLWSWGYNQDGELGDSTQVNKNIPTQIGTNNNWQAISSGFYHTLAIKKDGILWAWGGNFDEGNGVIRDTVGQLGDSTVFISIVPIQIGNSNDWKRVSAGHLHSLAIKKDSTLWAWGYNGSGELGDNTYINKYAPTEISNAKDWLSVSAANEFSVALKKDGTLWSWGFGAYGELGDGNTFSSEKIPTQVGSDFNWDSVSAAGDGDHVLALKNDHTLWSWGENSLGDLGNGNNTNQTAPAQVGTNINWNTICGGYGHSIILDNNGTLWACGRNDFGEIGDGTNVNKNMLISISCPSSSFIPVKWVSFKVKQQDNTVVATWQTESEQNITAYKIERSADSINFNEIGSINSFNNSQGSTYNYIDSGLSSTGTYYYRVKAIYNDGSKIYSSVQSVAYIFKTLTILLNANMQGKATLLTWQTNTDISTIQYIVEHSADSITFTSIDSMISMNSENGNNYTYTDTSLVKGYNYYRIQGVNKDGSNSYSNIKSIFYNGADSIISSGGQVSLYPNPVNNILYIQSNFTGNTLSIAIAEMSGRITGQYIYQNNSVISIPVSNLNNGIYTVKISDGVKTVIKKFIKG